MSRLQGILDEGPVRPKKSLGQNFLADPVYLRKIVDAAELSPRDVVLEIGPGTGNLTEHLLARAGHVVAVELDPRMVRLLEERFAGDPRLTLVHADILETDIGQRISPHLVRSYTYKVVANLPYYVTSAVLRLLLEAEVRPVLAVLTVQWEVAQRICARPGAMSLLAVAVQWYAVPRIVTRVPAGAFTPAPKVDSAVLRLETRATPPVPVSDEALLFRIARAGFSQRRKQLRNAVSAGLGIAPEQAEAALRAAGVDPKRRAETLSLQEWAALANVLAGGGAPKP
ncbi:MAG: 16S rRNA (adenine(1518)-N(6)/adenine(1519)-N(6))-dimethyltransferase RsmA [Anaerolineae bacterium]|nr:16S rRNA (adenine(1518)-N(6)/adenine(1519)-N(6))-dimethyltransferase RsmA [Anaerolineae bacterium]